MRRAASPLRINIMIVNFITFDFALTYFTYAFASVHSDRKRSEVRK